MAKCLGLAALDVGQGRFEFGVADQMSFGVSQEGAPALAETGLSHLSVLTS